MWNSRLLVAYEVCVRHMMLLVAYDVTCGIVGYLWHSRLLVAYEVTCCI
jgi:hypothetical protein